MDEPQPRMKSTVTKPKQPSETQDKDSSKKKEDSEKKVLQDKLHITATPEEGGKRLDPSKSERYRPGCWEPESVPQGSILSVKAGKN